MPATTFVSPKAGATEKTPWVVERGGCDVTETEGQRHPRSRCWPGASSTKMDCGRRRPAIPLGGDLHGRRSATGERRNDLVDSPWSPPTCARLLQLRQHEVLRARHLEGRLLLVRRQASSDTYSPRPSTVTDHAGLEPNSAPSYESLWHVETPWSDLWA